MMTRKDYVAIADALREARRQLEGMSSEGEDVFQTVMGELAAVLQADNPNFDRVRFERACLGGAK